MKEFVKLIGKIEQTKSTKEKTAYIQNYFERSEPADAAWALFFLSGKKLKRLIGPSKLLEWCVEALPLPEWIIFEAFSTVGDVAETIALLMVKKKQDSSLNDLKLDEWIREKILPLEKRDKEYQKQQILYFWHELNAPLIFILNKILTGSLRIGVSHALTIKALSQALQISTEMINLKLMGNWSPSAEFFNDLKNPENLQNLTGLNPYPFYLASPLDKPLEELGDIDDWSAEWKWDGIRAQCILRNDQAVIWSRRNELISHQFPEIIQALKKLEIECVLDGEILAFKDGKPLPFSKLQKRLGRKQVTAALIEEVPLVYMIYDILEYKGVDLRKKPFSERRAIFEKWLVIDSHIQVSPFIHFKSWDEIKAKRMEAASNFTEGLMLKKRNSPYLIGRRKGNWWKYKIDPKTIDAVLLYAEPGHGWRANLYTDYTFAVWHNQELVPIAKAYSGLTTEEIYHLDKWIRKNTVEKFGPVRKVKPEQVFEIAFDGIQISSRHKSGVALRFPRILRWRDDKPIFECDSLDDIKT